jgi:hypothetical protein
MLIRMFTRVSLTSNALGTSLISRAQWVYDRYCQYFAYIESLHSEVSYVAHKLFCTTNTSYRKNTKKLYKFTEWNKWIKEIMNSIYSQKCELDESKFLMNVICTQKCKLN